MFVANRIEIIKDMTDVQDWNYIPSKENPADLVSRGISPYDRKNLDLWLTGPSFLYESPDYKEMLVLEAPAITLSDLEIKQVFSREVTGNVEDLLTAFSSYEKLLKAVAWIRKFLYYLQVR
jgi:hypothetical protein